ncbi:MAG: hypothetical protein MR874_01090 [Coriobacteriaceae bacterium]|nr:hypothetical protein [Coriobacteriaceae bacterium]
MGDETRPLTTDGADVGAVASAFRAWAREGVRVMCVDAPDGSSAIWPVQTGGIPVEQVPRGLLATPDVRRWLCGQPIGSCKVMDITDDPGEAVFYDLPIDPAPAPQEPFSAAELAVPVSDIIEASGLGDADPRERARLAAMALDTWDCIDRNGHLYGMLVDGLAGACGLGEAPGRPEVADADATPRPAGAARHGYDGPCCHPQSRFHVPPDDGTGHGGR